MVKLNFVSNSLSKKHSCGMFHPESAQRIEVIEEWLHSQKDGIISYETSDQLASKDDILVTHTLDHYNLIEGTQGQTGHFYFDGDTAANDYTFDAARQAVAIGKKAVWESNIDISIFALVRPPGHHATRTSPGGFCIFNNIAIATELAITQNKYQKIAIIDFDQHFGNGTAYILEKNPNILYFSTHAEPGISYPGCGFVEEIGEAEGRGYNVPIPLGYRASEADLQVVFEELIQPIVYEFKPQFLAMSAGFDAYERDPIGVLGITEYGFSLIGKYILQIASELGIPFAHFLEGGYNIQSLPKLVSSYISPFIQDVKDSIIVDISSEASDQTIATVNRSKTLLNDYWQF